MSTKLTTTGGLSADADAKLKANIDRTELLPMLFKIKGEDYSLDKYPQMRALYQNVFVPRCLYLCGRQVSKCLPLSQLHKIALANGRPMTKEELKVGTAVLCVDRNERVTTGIISEVFDSGIKDVLKITTRMGRVIYISKEHKLRTLHGYTKGEDLKVGSPLASVPLVIGRQGFIWDEVEAIEDAGKEPCFDIEVANHHNFLLDGIVSHNSTNLSRSEVLDAIQIPQFQQLFIAPLKDQTLTYSKSVLQEAINTCRTAKLMQTRAFARKHGEGAFEIVNNLTHKTFSNGSSIRLSYASTDPDRVRGITADRVDFDEVQDQIIDNVSVIAESLSNSKWGIQRYTGTAKTLDNPIQKFWEESSQSEWAVKCIKGGCGFWNIPDKNHNVLKMIRPKGPCCAACGSPINPRQGQWVHGRPDKFNKFQGFHIPQIVLPAMVEDPKRWLAIVTKIAKLPESIIYTEVLGISTDQGTRLISQAEILAVSTLGPPHTVVDKGLHRYAQICLGVDWGIANITSFTAVAVCGITFNGNIECIHGEVWGGIAITEIFKKIASLVGQYECKFVACDYGAGFHNNQILSTEYGLPVTQLFYVTQGQFLNFTERMDIPLWKVDRNTALDTVFDNIKKGRIKFLDPEYSKSYTTHLLNVYEELVEHSAGLVRRKFDRVPDQPDDFLHALTFATLVLYQSTGNEVITVVPESKANQSVASQLVDKELGTEYYGD